MLGRLPMQQPICYGDLRNNSDGILKLLTIDERFSVRLISSGCLEQRK